MTSLKWVVEKEFAAKFDKQGNYSISVEAPVWIHGKGKDHDPDRIMTAATSGFLIHSLLLNLQILTLDRGNGNHA